MNIVMISNTYLPHIGGVANSVYSFSTEFEKRGHRVLIICPEFAGPKPDGPECFALPAWQKFNASDFSIPFPFTPNLTERLDSFKPDIIHSHHPFLLGDTALRLAAHYDLPLVFTHHTMYEDYTHYVPGDSEPLKKFVRELSSGYANLCDCVIAPSESIAKILRTRGVETKIEVVPTGVDLERFSHGDGESIRKATGIPANATVIGHAGRLAPEKNITFMANSVAEFVAKNKNSYFLVVGDGPSRSIIQSIFSARKLQQNLRLLGSRSGIELVNAYHAMDVFAFASKTETQGMVLTEALASGVPIVALDAPGAREVISHGINGELIKIENQTAFVESLERIVKLASLKNNDLKIAIASSVQSFSMENTATQALNIYKNLLGKPVISKKMDDSLWWRSLRQIETEWEIWSNRASSAIEALQPDRFSRFPLLLKLIRNYQRFRRYLNRKEFIIRLFRLSTEKKDQQAGLILIQIDGFSRTEFERALKRNRLPFLRRLLEREHYQLHTIYSGVPSTTPVAQASLFYGKKTAAVPSFEFFDRKTNQVCIMMDASSVLPIENALSKQGQGLLKGGSSYSNIYGGGAKESHFCASSIGWLNLLYSKHPFLLSLAFISHIWSFVRLIPFLILEFLLTCVDFFLGIGPRFFLARELKFIPVRMLVCILLRELITIGASVDAFRGLKVIHLNFLGYDEQAHRRGPSSRYAHWSLKGIDNCIRRIWKAAEKSPRRHYNLWVYSDHGQETTIPYPHYSGKSLEEGVQECLKEFMPSYIPTKKTQINKGIALKRASWLGGKILLKILDMHTSSYQADPSEIIVTNLGPIAHVYLPQRFPLENLDSACQLLATKAKIPLVIRYLGKKQAAVWKGSEKLKLPEDAEKIFGAKHQFLEEVTEDILQLLIHENVGDIVLSGWRPDREAISFPFENGAHGGPGPLETQAFCLLPQNVALPVMEKNFLRHTDLRAAAFEALGHTRILSRTRPKRTGPATIRLLTYNVHSCIGLDGVTSQSRIANIISSLDADIVALQELDVSMKRSQYSQQIEILAEKLGMNYFFQPALKTNEQSYGDAVLSRFPMRLIRAGILPAVPARKLQEPRAALWVEIEINGVKIQLINTHLGLRFGERKVQIEALMSEQWLGDPRCSERTIFCGDLNALPTSYVCRKISTRLRDAQQASTKFRSQQTYPSRLSMGRIDHIFTTNDFKVVRFQALKNAMTMIASDHLPLLAEFELPMKQLAPAPSQGTCF